MDDLGGAGGDDGGGGLFSFIPLFSRQDTHNLGGQAGTMTEIPDIQLKLNLYIITLYCRLLLETRNILCSKVCFSVRHYDYPINWRNECSLEKGLRLEGTVYQYTHN